MNLEAIRKELDLTPAEFARRLGVSRGHGHDLLTGRRKLTMRTAAELQRMVPDRNVLAETDGRAA